MCSRSLGSNSQRRRKFKLHMNGVVYASHACNLMLGSRPRWRHYRSQGGTHYAELGSGWLRLVNFCVGTNDHGNEKLWWYPLLLAVVITVALLTSFLSVCLSVSVLLLLTFQRCAASHVERHQRRFLSAAPSRLVLRCWYRSNAVLIMFARH